MKFDTWLEKQINNSLTPKFKKGDRCVYIGNVGDVPAIIEDDMVIESDGSWCDYDNHPKGGYYQYSIVGKVNECPEDFLILYTGQKVGSIIK